MERLREVQRCGRRDRVARRGTETQNGWSHIHVSWIKIVMDKNWGGYLRSEGFKHPAWGSSARKISPHNFWL